MLEKLTEIETAHDEVLRAMQDEAVIQDFSEYNKLAKKLNKTATIYDKYKQFKKLQIDIKEARELGMQELLDEWTDESDKLWSEMEELLKPRDERDDGNVIMEIRPAAGGDEAALFAGVLLRMYTMYARSQGFNVEIFDLDETEIGGVKSASLTIEGNGAFSHFKYESGVHRVQRVPETETQGRIHTSTATVAVLPEAVEVDFKIDEKDLRVDVYRSSGAGGQHVNKTESAVRITHIPTGTVVACQDNRSQIKNREKAMAVLQSKLADYYQEQADKSYADTRKNQVGTGDRSERIRTYNYPQGRVTDHRIGKSLHNLPGFLNGDIGEMVSALKIAAQQVN